MSAGHNFRRFQAIAETASRHSAIVSELAAALERAALHLDGEEHAAAEQALDIAQAQIQAISDALDAALADLPEGQAL